MSGIILFWSLPGLAALAEPDEAQQQACLQRAALSAPDALTLKELRRRCRENPGDFSTLQETEAAGDSQQRQAISTDERRSLELSAASNPYGITPHRVNYLLPVTYSKNPNRKPFGEEGEAFDKLETKFQFSYKVPVFTQILGQDIDLFFAYTNQSWWQAYNGGISRPFRETNHEPELFATWTDLWVPQGLEHVQYSAGVSHQSNGRSGEQSRSWNRVYADVQVQKQNMFAGLKVWDRIPDDDKDYPGDPHGDDNPDIEHFMGNFELNLAYARNRQSIGLLVRNNLNRSNNKGALQIDYSFPMTDSLYGYVQYFNGYGESLIDYNHDNERIGFGIAINEWP